MFEIRLHIEPANGSIHRFNGSVDFKEPDTSVRRRVALSEKNLLLRGSVLRATEWTVGIVAYTGKNTKLSLNSKGTPSKLSSVDRIVNKTLLIAISAMLIVCVLSMISNVIWGAINSNAHYLCLRKEDMNGECSDGIPNAILTVFTFATLYNNFVCISMYVSLGRYSSSS